MTVLVPFLPEQHVTKAIHDGLKVQLLHGLIQDVIKKCSQGRGNGARVHIPVHELCMCTNEIGKEASCFFQRSTDTLTPPSRTHAHTAS